MRIARSIAKLSLRAAMTPLLFPFYQGLHRFAITPYNKWRNSRRPMRQLEIGPGTERIPGFETLNVRAGPHTDYVLNATKRLPFTDQVFDFIYASHVIEHIPWFNIEVTLKEWSRLLKPGGMLEVWLPDGYKLSKMLCDIEEGRARTEWSDGWRPDVANSPYLWINGRLLYGLRGDYPSWHRAIVTPRLLQGMFEAAGLIDVQILAPREFRTVDHGWINLGMRGRRP